MGDLRDKRLMYLKAALFLAIGCIGCVAALLLLLECGSGRVALYLALAVWAFCRAYYFAFYVIEHYIDSTFKFSGLMSFVRYLLAKDRTN